MVPPIVIRSSNRIRTRPRTREATTRILVADEEEVEVLLETPEDVNQLTGIARIKKSLRIRLADKLFGPPKWTLRWNQRRSLFQKLGNLENLTTLVVHGTIMGQVVRGHSLALSISAPNLRILKVEGGIILDSITYIVDMAEAVRNHKSLAEFSFLNFLNHIIPVDSLYLLDPLLGALCTIPNMTKLQLRCFSSFMHWDSSFASTSVLRRLLQSMTCLRHLELTNLGLGDEQMRVIATNANSATQPKLRELILNANGNTKKGLSYVLKRIQPPWTKLEVANDHARLNKDSFDILYGHLRSYSNCLQYFACTFPLVGMEDCKQSIDLQLELHRMNLNARYYAPHVSPGQRVQLLISEVVTRRETNELDFVYTLLREEPMICDLEMNGLDVRSILLLSPNNNNTRMQQMTLLVLLWLIWTRYLLLGVSSPSNTTTTTNGVDMQIETGDNLLVEATTNSSMSFEPAIGQEAAAISTMSRLERARSKRNAMRSRVQLKINALTNKATPSTWSGEEKSQKIQGA